MFMSMCICNLLGNFKLNQPESGRRHIWKDPRSNWWLGKSLEVLVWIIDLEPMIISEGLLVWCGCASTEGRDVNVSVVICKPAQPERRKRRSELADGSDLVSVDAGKGTAPSGLVCVASHISVMHAYVCVCACACARMWVHLHLEYVPSLNWEGNQQQTGKGGEIPWALKSPGLSFPEARTVFPQTGSLRLFPFHGSAAVEAPAALQVKCFPAPQ